MWFKNPGRRQATLLLTVLTLFYHPTAGQDKFQSLETEIRKIIKDTKAVGVSVALIDNYELVWAKGFGVTEIGTSDSVTDQTLFQGKPPVNYIFPA